MANIGGPIIVPGLDRDEQLGHDFEGSTFETFWLRRSYTDENNPLLKCSDRRKQREIRFGNNITILIKACLHLRTFYGLPSFWSVIAKGFGGSNAEMVEERVFRLGKARRTFLQRTGGSSMFRSAATDAADAWIAFLDSPCSQQPPRARTTELESSGMKFFSQHRSSLIDSARMSFEGDDAASSIHTSARFVAPAGPRKRSPSPNQPGQPPNAKRRQISDASDGLGTVSVSKPLAPHSLPPLRTGLAILGAHAKQEPYQTPSSAQDGPTPDGYSEEGTPDEPAGFRIRGIAHDNFQSPSHSVMEERTFSYEDLRRANALLDIRVQTLEKDKKQSKEVTRAMETKFAQLEERLRAFESRPAQADKSIKELYDKVASLDKSLQAVLEQLPNKSKALQDLRDKVSSLEKRLESEAHKLEDTEALQSLQEKVGTLATRIGSVESSMVKKDETIEDMQIQLDSLNSNKADANDEKLSAEAGSIRELHSRITSLMQQQEQISEALNRPADQNSAAERLERQVTSSLQISLKTQQGLGGKIKELDEMITTLQGKITTGHDDLLGRIKSLPTSESVSEKVARSATQVEQNLGDMVEDYRKQALEDAEGHRRDAQAITVCDQSTHADKLAKQLEQTNSTLQSMSNRLKVLEGKVNIMNTTFDIAQQSKPQNSDLEALTGQVSAELHRLQNIEKVQQARISVDTSNASERLDQLTRKVDCFLGDEYRVTAADMEWAFRRIENLQTAFRLLKAALTGDRP